MAALGGFLFGYDLVMISGAVIFLQEEFGLSAAGLGFTTASAVIGCIAGPIVGSRLCDLLGRKRTLITANLLFGISAIGTALPETIDQFNFFRVIGGIGCGLVSVASPMYLAEVAPARLRGRLVMMYQLAIVVGAFSATLVAYYLAFFEAWRWMFASELVPILVFGVLLTLVSMSLVDRVGRRPIWLVTSLGMVFGVTLLGAIFHFNLTGLVVVGAVLMCAWPHVIGLGPLPWVMMSEVMPTRVRARAVSIATMCLWIANYSGVHALPVLLESSEERFGSPAAVFWIFTFTCALAFVFGWKYVPETKGKSLEKIARDWRHSGHP